MQCAFSVNTSSKWSQITWPLVSLYWNTFFFYCCNGNYVLKGISEFHTKEGARIYKLKSDTLLYASTFWKHNPLLLNWQCYIRFWGLSNIWLVWIWFIDPPWIAFCIKYFNPSSSKPSLSVLTYLVTLPLRFFSKLRKYSSLLNWFIISAPYLILSQGSQWWNSWSPLISLSLIITGLRKLMQVINLWESMMTKDGPIMNTCNLHTRCSSGLERWVFLVCFNLLS